MRMQEDDVLEFGEMLVRANETVLIVVGDVSALAGALRRGTKDYLRHLVGTGAALRGYFGESDMDLDSAFAVEGIGEAFGRELPGAVERGQRWDEEIRAGAGFDGEAKEVELHGHVLHVRLTGVVLPDDAIDEVQLLFTDAGVVLLLPLTAVAIGPAVLPG